jgi:nucleoside-diphosphate-sugar epimerase
VNPSIILGEGDPSESSVKIFSRVYNGLRWYTEGSTGFVDVRDVATAMISIMDSDISSERFILSAGNHTFREVCDMIAEGFGKPRPSLRASRTLSSLLWRVEKIRTAITGSAPLITKETAQSAHARVGFDNSKLLRFFPDFRYIPVERSISETCGLLKERWKKN